MKIAFLFASILLFAYAIQCLTLTQPEKDEIVNTHNMYRSQMALGTHGRSLTTFPKAGNMMKLYWNEKIAAKAQQWANGHKFQHSTYQFRQQGTMSIGENIYIFYTTDPNQIVSWQSVVADWFNEIDNFTGNVSSLSGVINADGKQIGHFTQVIWAKTYMIGCGSSKYKEGQFWTTLIVCQYGPAGNYIGESIYDPTGVPCSTCPADTVCCPAANPGLCCISPDKLSQWLIS